MSFFHKHTLCIIGLLLGFSCNVSPPNIELPESASIQLIDSALKQNPSNPYLLNRRAIYNIAAKNYPQALKDIQQAIKMDSLNSAYLVTLSDIYLYTNETRKTRETLEKAVRIDPKNTDALLKLAELFFYVQKHQEAMDNINKALEIDQHIAKGYFMKGMIYKELGDTNKAISSMITATEQDQNYYHAFVEVAALYAFKKDKLAISYLDNALKLNPKSEEALYMKAKLLQDFGDWDSAIELYKKLVSIHPTHKSSIYNLAVIYGAQKKEYSLALEAFDKAIKIDSLYYQAYFGRATCYELLGKKQEALIDYKKTLFINPSYTVAQESINALSK